MSDKPQDEFQKAKEQVRKAVQAGKGREEDPHGDFPEPSKSQYVKVWASEAGTEGFMGASCLVEVSTEELLNKLGEQGRRKLRDELRDLDRPDHQNYTEKRSEGDILLLETLIKMSKIGLSDLDIAGLLAARIGTSLKYAGRKYEPTTMED